MKRVRYWVLAAVVVLALLALLPSPHVKADDASIVGTWMVASTIPPFVFTELASFNRGGTFIDTFSLDENSANPFVPPALAVNFSSKFGIWKQVGDSNQFAITFKEFLFAGALTPTSVYGPILFPGQNVGMATVDVVATLQTADTATGPFTFQLTNLQGVVVFAGSGTFTATRLKIQPLATP